MKLTVINKWLVAFGILTLVSGLVLHIGYATLMKHHSAHEAWEIGHIICAAALVILAVMHVVKNDWWFPSLKSAAKSHRTVYQRIFTPAVILIFLALFGTGLCMLVGWYSAHSNIWNWHYYLGIAWAVIAIVHAYFFHRPHTPKQA